MLNNNLFPNNADKLLAIKDFVSEISDADWNRLQIKASPARKLSDLFYLKLPWNLIKSELGEINIFDAGCGSGDYGEKLLSYSNDLIDSYYGIDLHENNNWQVLMEKHKNIKFRRLDSALIIDYIPAETNFFLTQSALEHFDYDLLYFRQLHDFIQKESKDIIQVHLMPSSVCLWKYLFHGVRQYTPRTISKITRMFNDFSYAILYKLGGKECNLLHLNFITIPLFIKKIGDIRDSKTEDYEKLLFNAIKKDMLKSQTLPSFYALIIHSNFKKNIFSSI
jgi:hypothetical protein